MAAGFKPSKAFEPPEFPAPWRFHDDEGGLISDADGKPVAFLSSRFAGEDDAIVAKVSGMIVAAPELLAACLSAKQLLISDLEEPGRSVFWHLVAAIRKAGVTLEVEQSS